MQFFIHRIFYLINPSTSTSASSSASRLIRGRPSYVITKPNIDIFKMGLFKFLNIHYSYFNLDNIDGGEII
jgi:hypothetical protein